MTGVLITFVVFFGTLFSAPVILSALFRAVLGRRW